jgi:hypothetical protein
MRGVERLLFDEARHSRGGGDLRMPECKDCRHYRLAAAARVPIQSLRWLTSSPQAAISQEFKRIAEEERASKEIEAKREKEYEQKAATLMATHGLSFRSKAPLPEGDVECFDSQIKPQLLRNRFNEEPRATTQCVTGRIILGEILRFFSRWFLIVAPGVQVPHSNQLALKRRGLGPSRRSDSRPACGTYLAKKPGNIAVGYTSAQFTPI